jgi:hypothetical protein
MNPEARNWLMLWVIEGRSRVLAPKRMRALPDEAFSFRPNFVCLIERWYRTYAASGECFSIDKFEQVLKVSGPRREVGDVSNYYEVAYKLGPRDPTAKQEFEIWQDAKTEKDRVLAKMLANKDEDKQQYQKLVEQETETAS